MNYKISMFIDGLFLEVHSFQVNKYSIIMNLKFTLVNIILDLWFMC